MKKIDRTPLLSTCCHALLDKGVFWLCFISLTLVALQSPAQSFPAGFSQITVASGISNPTALAFAPDGRIFVAEQAGNVRIIKKDSLLTNPFLHITVDDTGERGLIGLTLDPNFATNHFLYLYYTLPGQPAHNRISRFTARGDSALAGSEAIILELDPLSKATNHNGGAMHFGKDGKLYVAIGENARGINAQNLDTYHGKMLRINPDGSIPAGNPYREGSEQKRRVWAYGLRNPYTFSFQSTTGRLFINDVGLNTWEEIDDVTASNRNFGWPQQEGYNKSEQDTTVNPLYVYPHGWGFAQGCAITGGTFFNPPSTNYPAEYLGKYFFQDYCNKWINVMDIIGAQPERAIFATSLSHFGVNLSVGNDGNLYYLSRSQNALFKIIYTSNVVPAITEQPTSLQITLGQPANFRASASGANPLTYQWQKNGVNIPGATAASYTIARVGISDGGQYRVIVSNPAGKAISQVSTLAVLSFNAPPQARIISPVTHSTYRAGDVINFSGTATDSEDGLLPESTFSWVLNFHHDAHQHDGPPISQGKKSGFFSIPDEGETSVHVWYRLILTVKDSQGLSASDSIDLDPTVVKLALNTVPAGLSLILDGQTVRSPYTQEFVSGMLVSLNAPVQQQLRGETYALTGWQPAAGTEGSITIPEADTTYTANYRKKLPLLDPIDAGEVVSGLNYRYYEGAWTSLPDFSSLTADKIGAVSNFDISARNLDDNFAFQYTGYVQVPSDGEYTFYTRSDDGSQLFIGSQLVVNNDSVHASREVSGMIGLKAGLHPITVAYFDGNGGQVLKVSYAGPGISKQLVPSTVLYRQAEVDSLRPADKATGVVSGVTYNYYEGNYAKLPDFATLTPVKSGSVANVDLSPRAQDDNFAFQYTGYVQVPSDGEYTFYTRSDDGSQLFIGSKLIVDNDSIHAGREVSGKIGLKAGLHAMRVTYFDNIGGEGLKVSYAGPGISKQWVPATVLYHLADSLRPADTPSGVVSGLNYRYYEGAWASLPDFSALVAAKIGTVADFDLSARNRDDNFAFQYTGYIQVPSDGKYTFYTRSDDGSQLFIGSQLVVNNDSVHASREVSGMIGLKAGLHPITVTFFEGKGGQVLKVNYEGPSITKQAISPGMLYTTDVSQVANVRRVGEDKHTLDEAGMQLLPNPAREYVTLRFNTETAQEARVNVTDLLARNVATAFKQVQAGPNEIPLYVGHLSPGIYSLILQLGNRQWIKRVVVTK